MKLIILFTFPSFILASIFGADDREEFYELKPNIMEVSKASIAIIPKSRLKLNGQSYLLRAQSLQKSLNFCSGSSFSNQKMLANCSGSLLKNGHLLTAAHCFNDKYPATDYYAVFNYKKLYKNQNITSIKKEDVFEIKQNKYYKLTYTGLDLAVYKLDKVPKYKPLKIATDILNKNDKVLVMGYPLGTALKVSNDSSVTSTSIIDQSFRHQLDTFSVNSGSPILNIRNELVGVHVRGTGSNFKKYSNDCNDWFKGTYGKDFGEANFVYSILNVKLD